MVDFSSEVMKTTRKGHIFKVKRKSYQHRHLYPVIIFRNELKTLSEKEKTKKILSRADLPSKNGFKEVL